MNIMGQKGQILIIFLGIMGLALGVGVSMNQRAAVSLQEGNRSILSTQAYYAAEAGAEEGLVDSNVVSNCPGDTPCSSDSSFSGNCSYSYYAEASSAVDISLGKDKVLVLNTEGASASGSITFFWNKTADVANGIEITQIYDDPATLQTKHYAFDCRFSPAHDGFSSSEGSKPGGYGCSTSAIAFETDSKRIIVKMLFDGGPSSGAIGYTASPTLPQPQGVVITSTGTCGEIERTVRVTKPLFGSGQDFSFGLFAPNDDLDLN